MRGIQEGFLEEVTLALRAEGCSSAARQRGGRTYQTEDTTLGKGLRSREDTSISKAGLDKGMGGWG